MTDKDIIKALECCVNDNCYECPFRFGNCRRHELLKDALNIIKSKRTEGKEEKLTIVSVRFGARADKTYDYEYIGDAPIQIGDTVMVETEYRGTQQVEVVNVFQIYKSQAKYDYKPAR